MSDPQPDVDEAARWRSEAADELHAAEVVAAHDELPDRIAGFHAHLAAEKALKALVIRRRIQLPRIHDLVGLRALLPDDDQQLFADEDLRTLNPWTIDGRYPADIEDDVDVEISLVVEAARRVLANVPLSPPTNEPE